MIDKIRCKGCNKIIDFKNSSTIERRFNSFKINTRYFLCPKCTIIPNIKIAETIYKGRFKKQIRFKTFIWEIIFKPLLTAFLIAFLRFMTLFKPDVVPYRQKTIVEITKKICKDQKWRGLAKIRAVQGAIVLSYFLAIDNAYNQAFERFNKQYYERHNQRKLN